MSAISSRRRREVYQITQKTGASVVSRSNGMRGVVTGHYDDDSVYVLFEGVRGVSRWWVEDLEIERAEETS